MFWRGWSINSLGIFTKELLLSSSNVALYHPIPVIVSSGRLSLKITVGWTFIICSRVLSAGSGVAHVPVPLLQILQNEDSSMVISVSGAGVLLIPS